MKIISALIQRATTAPYLATSVIGTLLLFSYHLLNVPDFWGDAYHNLIISIKTAENGWVYDDYKGRHLVWLPAYRYFMMIFMALSGRFDLPVAAAVNGILLILSGFLVANLIKTAGGSSNRMLLGGLLTVSSSWLIAYSHQNMPEVFSAILLLLVLYFRYSRPNGTALFLVTVALALNRTETVMILFFYWAFLVWKREWKTVILIAAGTALGLGLWAAWCWYKTGVPWFWLERHLVGSHNDAVTYRPDRTILPAIGSMLAAFPVLVMLLRRRKHVAAAGKSVFQAAVVMGGAHWLFVLIGQLWLFPYPDPRYLLPTLPLLIVVFSTVVLVNKTTLALMSSIHLAGLVGNMVYFDFKGHWYDNRFAAGRYLAERVSYEEGKRYWIDSPEVWYKSNLPARALLSSDELTKEGHTTSRTMLGQRLEQGDIPYMVWFDATYTLTATLFPELAHQDSLQIGKVILKRVFDYPDSTSQYSWQQQQMAGIQGDTWRTSIIRITVIE
jgi:hypothetical protein